MSGSQTLPLRKDPPASTNPQEYVQMRGPPMKGPQGRSKGASTAASINSSNSNTKRPSSSDPSRGNRLLLTR